MKRIAMILVLLSPLLMAGGRNDCVVSPDPVVKPGDFVITAFGGTPGETYWVRTDWAKQSFGHHADGSGVADENGVVTIQMNTDDQPNNIIPVGSVRARVYPFDGGNTTLARCTFEVVSG